MASSNSGLALIWSRSLLRLTMVGLLAIAGMQCTTGDDGGTPPKAVIVLLKPTDGQKIKMTDSLKIISKSDYTKFGGSLSYSVSEDSGKTWIFIKSQRQVVEGVAVLDTVIWVPSEFGMAAGPIKFRVQEYDKVYQVVSGFMTLEAAIAAKP